MSSGALPAIALFAPVARSCAKLCVDGVPDASLLRLALDLAGPAQSLVLDGHAAP